MLLKKPQRLVMDHSWIQRFYRPHYLGKGWT
jgi:hypothetical protein